MALGSIPPWLDVTPGMFVGAAEAGARAGTALAEQSQRAGEFSSEMALKNRSLDQSAAESAAERDLQEQKLTSGLAESGKERALQEKLSTRAQDLAQNRFNVGTALDQAHLGVQNAQLQLRGRQLDLAEKTKQAAADSASKVHDAASEFFAGIARGEKPRDLLSRNPLASKDPGVRQLVGEDFKAEQAKSATGRTGTLSYHAPAELGGTSPFSLSYPAGSPEAQAFLRSQTNVPPELRGGRRLVDPGILVNPGPQSGPRNIDPGMSVSPTPLSGPRMQDRGILVDPGNPESGRGDYSTTADVAAAYKAGQITREQAAQALKDQFGITQ